MLHLSLGYGKIKPQKQLRPLAFRSLGLRDQIVSHMYQNEFGWSNHGQTTFHTLFILTSSCTSSHFQAKL